jgi:hypothetical protein
MLVKSEFPTPVSLVLRLLEHTVVCAVQSSLETYLIPASVDCCVVGHVRRRLLSQAKS